MIKHISLSNTKLSTINMKFATKPLDSKPLFRNVNSICTWIAYYRIHCRLKYSEILFFFLLAPVIKTELYVLLQ